MDSKKLKVCWISAGVSSFIAGYLERDTIDKFIYIDIADQHQDSMRFIKDCEKVLGRKIEKLKSPYVSVEGAIRAAGLIRNARSGFYPCTNWLKKRIRKEWEYKHKDYDITYVWGFDCNEGGMIMGWNNWLYAERVGQKEQAPKPMTNADRIRAMSDEELSTLLCDISDCSTCRWGEYSGCIVKEWLKQPAVED